MIFKICEEQFIEIIFSLDHRRVLPSAIGASFIAAWNASPAAINSISYNS